MMAAPAMAATVIHTRAPSAIAGGRGGGGAGSGGGLGGDGGGGEMRAARVSGSGGGLGACCGHAHTLEPAAALLHAV